LAIPGLSGQRPNKESMDKVYFCQTCKVVYLFSEDLEMHQRETGHRDVARKQFEDDIDP
jgi:hypothetical protein